PLQVQQLRQMEAETLDPSKQIDKEIEDDVLRLIFTCCHPALPPETRTAMTLREVCNVTTEEIARAFLVAPATIAQRIVRGKAKIREAKIPFEVPQQHELPERDRKSTRLNSSHVKISYAVFCLKKKIQ